MSMEPRIAIIHEWLDTYSGAEHLLEELIRIYPQADLYCVVDFLSERDREFLKGRNVKTTFIQGMPYARKLFRAYLPLMPIAIEQLDLSGYDILISSSHAVSKGILVGPDQLHVSYVHTPLRYAWDFQHQYLAEMKRDSRFKSAIAMMILHYMRLWDQRTAAGVDQFVANSNFIARRIRKTYRREAEVIYPPIDSSTFELCESKQEYYLTASRLVPYKNVPLIVEAFRRLPDKKLVVIGDGPDMKKVKALASSNVSVLGYQPVESLRSHMQRAKAFIFAAEEDFGISPVEAQSCGTPVIAYGKGGVLETVRDIHAPKPTGLFFSEQTPESICAAVAEFEQIGGRIQPAHCRENALRFSPERFRAQFASLVDRNYRRLKGTPVPSTMPPAREMEMHGSYRGSRG